MLPFMKKNIKSPGLIVSHRKPDEDKAPEDGSALEAAAQDILRAISDNDFKHLALALQAAYDICEANEPHSESEENDFHSRNEAAARESQE